MPGLGSGKKNDVKKKSSKAFEEKEFFPSYQGQQSSSNMELDGQIGEHCCCKCERGYLDALTHVMVGIRSLVIVVMSK
jgi:hypothetical protein